MSKKQVKTKLITVEYTDGRKIVIVPYKNEERIDYGFEYYGKNQEHWNQYEGSWNAERVANWFREILEDDSADYEKEFDRIQMEYSPN